MLVNAAIIRVILILTFCFPSLLFAQRSIDTQSFKWFTYADLGKVGDYLAEMGYSYIKSESSKGVTKYSYYLNEYENWERRESFAMIFHGAKMFILTTSSQEQYQKQKNILLNSGFVETDCTKHDFKNREAMPKFEKGETDMGPGNCYESSDGYILVTTTIQQNGYTDYVFFIVHPSLVKE